MSLKGNPEREALPPLNGPGWGRLAEKGTTAAVVSFVIGENSVSYPAHGLKRWELSPGPPEMLKIEAGEEVVTVSGRGLHVIRDALDAGLLVSLRVRTGRFAPVSTGETVVLEINIRSARPGGLNGSHPSE